MRKSSEASGRASLDRVVMLTLLAVATAIASMKPPDDVTRSQASGSKQGSGRATRGQSQGQRSSSLPQQWEVSPAC